MSKNTIPFKHAKALGLLREEREMLKDELRSIKKRINHMQFLRMNEPDDYVYFNWESMYGGGVSKLTKLQNQWRKDLKDIEESINVLKRDGQAHHQGMWEDQQHKESMEQHKESVASGSYNCLGGC